MMTVRWRPWMEMQAEVNRLQDEVNRLFGRWTPAAVGALRRAEFPALNLWEDENNLYVEAELPGLELSNLEITVTGGNQLSIKGERPQPTMEKGRWHREERGYGKFSRLVELPFPVCDEKVAAEFKHGVMTITLPKREEAKPRRIEIKVN